MGRKIHEFKVKVFSLPHLPLNGLVYNDKVNLTRTLDKIIFCVSVRYYEIYCAPPIPLPLTLPYFPHPSSLIVPSGQHRHH